MKQGLLLFSMYCSILSPCSNIAVLGNSFTVTARTMDFPFNTGNVIGVGLKNRYNTSDLNLEKGVYQKHAKSWKNNHQFIGQTWCEGNTILDGINDAGLYGGYLYLPDFTKYPSLQLDSTNPKRRLLGICDILNYVLGQAGSVEEALKLLNNVNLVPNAVKTKNPKVPGLFVMVPIHLVIRDKSGDAAVFEWIDGKTKIYHPAGDVLTNAPPYDWQVKNAKKYNYVKSENTNVKVDGAYMEGSGFKGIPGDWTPPSRFVRATQLLKHTPKPTSTNSALQQALSVINTAEVPLGSNPSPTLWKTTSDLNNQRYYFYPMYEVSPLYAVLGKDKDAKVVSPNPMDAVQKYELNKINRMNIPKGAIEVRLSATNQNDIKKIQNAIDTQTPGAN